MITLIFGNNSYEVKQRLNQLVEGFTGQAEVFDADNLQAANLPDLLMGSSLFASKRMIIIKYPSQNKTLWVELNNFIDKVVSDTQLVLVDDNIDKRTITFKALKQVADIQECLLWSDYDTQKAEDWLQKKAIATGLRLDRSLISLIVKRVGLDQWQLAQALDKLSLLDEINESVIVDTIDLAPSENVFELLENAINGKADKLKAIVFSTQQAEDPFRVFALMSSQIFQALAVMSSNQSHDPAKDFAMHPFVVTKMRALSKKLSLQKIKKIVGYFSQADLELKSSKSEPWTIIENLLIKIANS